MFYKVSPRHARGGGCSLPREIYDTAARRQNFKTFVTSLCVGAALGLVFGIAIGAVLRNVAVGIGVGVAMVAVFGAAFVRISDRK